MNSNKLTHNLVQSGANYSRLIQDRISHYSSRVSNVLSTNPIGSALSGVLAIGVPIVMLANGISEAKGYANNEVKLAVTKTYKYPANPVNYEGQTIPGLLTQKGKYQVLDLMLFKKVTKSGIGPIQFVQEEFNKSADWKDIKGKLVSENGEILTDSQELRFNQAYTLTESVEKSVEVAKSIKGGNVIQNIPSSPKQIVTEGKQVIAKMNIDTDKQTEIRVRTINASYGSNMIDSLDIPGELHDEVGRIFSKLNINANAHTLLKGVAKKESNCGDTTINYLTKAKQSNNPREQISLINFAIGNILGTSNDAALFQITPGFAGLKNIDGNIIKNREELKNYLFASFLRYVNPELFEEKLSLKKAENSRQYAVFTKVSTIVDSYLQDSNKSKLEIDDLFNIIAKIDVRFANREMGIVVVNSFIKDYQEISVRNPKLSHISRVKLAFSRYNKGPLNATVDTNYSNSLLGIVLSFAGGKNDIILPKEQPVIQKVFNSVIQQDKLNISPITGTQVVLNSLPQKESVKLVASVSKSTNKVITSPQVLVSVKDEKMRTAIVQKLDNAPLEVQIAHYEKDPSKISTLKKLYEIDYNAKSEQLKKSRLQLGQIEVVINKIESGNFSDEFSTTRLEKFKNAKYTLEKQISYLEASISEIEGKDVYRYAMVV